MIPERLSPIPWVDQRCRAALRSALEWLGPALEPFGLRVLFLGGSAALGEAVGWRGPDGEGVVLSDLDLGAVTWRDVPPARRREIARRLAGRDGAGGEAGPRPTLGLYGTRYQGVQAPTPGLVDLVRAGIPLCGDARVLRRFTVPAPERIPGWEAYRLIGNRSWELLTSPDPSGAFPDRARALHGMAKACFGLWTAWLILDGRYRVGTARRLGMLDATPASGPDAAALPEPVGTFLPEPGGAAPSGSGVRRAPRSTGEASPGPEAAAAGARGTAAGAPAEVLEAVRAWRRFLLEPGEDLVPGDAARLDLFGRGLTALLRRRGHPIEELARGGAEGPDAPFLRPPVRIRDRVRGWLSVCRTWGSGPYGFPWALRSGLEATPEARKLGAAVLYWICVPERPEPAWGRTARGAEEPTAIAAWTAGTRRLLGRTLPPGAGARGRLIETLRRL